MRYGGLTDSKSLGQDSTLFGACTDLVDLRDRELGCRGLEATMVKPVTETISRILRACAPCKVAHVVVVWVPVKVSAFVTRRTWSYMSQKHQSVHASGHIMNIDEPVTRALDSGF